MNLSSGYPFWLIKYGLPFDYPMLQEDTVADVVIIGGGISGALTAHYLIESGIDCMLIDGRTIGLGSTCASTSLLQYEIDVPLCELQHKIGLKKAVMAYKLCEEAIDRLGHIAKMIGFSDFQKRESLFYAATKREDAFLKEEYNIRKQHGFEVRLLGESDIKEGFHIKASSAILSAKAAQTNAYNFTHALHQHGIKKGLRIFDRTEAVSIKHSKSGVILKTNNAKNIRAKRLIYANGYEAVKYVKEKIVRLDSTYAICSEQLEKNEIQMNTNALMWNTANPYLYSTAIANDRIIVGGRDEKFYSPQKRDALIHKKTRQLEEDFKKLFPGTNFKTEFSWAGTFGSTKDGLPFIGEYKKLMNSYFALGFGGNGITFSLIAAAFLTDIIIGRHNSSLEIFSFERN